MIHWVFLGFIGIIVGWIAGKLVHGKGMGIIPDMVVGILGALIGGFLADFFQIYMAGVWGRFCISILGAVVLLVVIRLIRSS